VTYIPPTPDADKLDAAVEVLGWLEAIGPESDRGHAGHFAWVCRVAADRQRTKPATGPSWVGLHSGPDS